MKRREFITLLGGAAAAWPLAARAQQQQMPTVGFLGGLSAADRPDLTEALRQGLNDAGYNERNVKIEYRYADNRMDQLQALATELINRKVAVIAAVGGNNTALVAKSLTSTIPIVFTSGLDPVEAELVTSLNRPEANVTGVSWFSAELGQKHVELLRELAPQADKIGLLVNDSPEGAFHQQSAQEGARALGRRLLVVKAGTPNDIDGAFATLVQQRANAVLVGAGPFYPTRARQIAVLAARQGLPLVSTARELPAAGGLVSYGNRITDAYRRAGRCIGRILNGARTADIPIDRATKFELVINLGTAKALGITVPPMLLARADEVIE